MHFVIHALDRPDAGDLRASTRERHLDYLAGFDVVFGGPLLDDEGEMCGSLIVVDVDVRALKGGGKLGTVKVAISRSELDEALKRQRNRMLVATAVVHDFTLITADERILAYPHLLSFDARN